MAKENGIQGKVIVQFVVWKDGSIKDVNIVKGVHKSLDKEAIRVVKKCLNGFQVSKMEKLLMQDLHSLFNLRLDKFTI